MMGSLLAFSTLLLFLISRFQVFARGRILGGQDAAPGEFPWAAAIWVEDIYFCSGSLLSPFHVLTAAHCVHGYANFRVIMGVHNLQENFEASRQTRNTTTVIMHEGFDPRTMKNDVALLRLTFPFFLTPWVKWVRLPPFNRKDDTRELRTATFTGWGLEDDDAQDLSTILQKMDLSVIPNEDCASLFPPKTVGDIHLCTNTTKSQSPCRGDSGGALTVVDADGRRTQIGIDSFSSGLCSAGFPEVFSRVSYFVPWIRSKANFLIREM